jgi:hypothetical protein
MFFTNHGTNDNSANDPRRYKSTEQVFDPEQWPKARFEQAYGFNTINMSPWRMASDHFATKATAEMLAEKLDAKVLFVDGPTSGPFSWPGSLHLDFGVEGRYPNAGLVGKMWNRAIKQFKRDISNWNLNVGPNNQYHDPQENTPTILVSKRIHEELGIKNEEV